MHSLIVFQKLTVNFKIYIINVLMLTPVIITNCEEQLTFDKYLLNGLFYYYLLAFQR